MRRKIVGVLMRKFLAVCVGALTFSCASAQTVGDWTYSLRDPFYAATINDSGNVFGQWCDLDDRSCFYLVAFPTRCEEDDKYPVLINSDKGSFSTTLICRGKLKNRNLYRYVFANFDQIDGLAKSAQRVGVAIPLEGDEFRVIRFSLVGASVALTAMRAAGDRAVPASDRRGTRDQNL